LTITFGREVLPNCPDAWMDRTKDKARYEINFNRHFLPSHPARVRWRRLILTSSSLRERFMRLLREVLVKADWSRLRLKFTLEKIGSGKTPLGDTGLCPAGVMLLRSQNVHFDGLHVRMSFSSTRKPTQKWLRLVFKADDVLLNITGASLGRALSFQTMHRKPTSISMSAFSGRIPTECCLAFSTL